MSKLASTVWWKAASLRALYTAVAIAVPYLGGALLADVPWLTILSAAAVGFLASIATSLAGLPETEGVDLPWWLAAVERVVKTFAQALAAGFIGATLLTDVAWSTVVQAAVIAALTSLLRLILATLPADPSTRPHVAISGVHVQHGGQISIGDADVDVAARPVPGTMYVAEDGMIRKAAPDQ